MRLNAHDLRLQLRVPPPRTFVLICAAAVVGLLALVSVDLSAQATSYNLCDRTTAARDQILLALQYPDREIDGTPTYGAVNSTYASWGTFDTSTGAYTSVNCTSSNRLTITATALASDASWIHWTKLFNLSNKGLTELVPSDFAGLTQLQEINIGNNQITSIPDNIFQGKGVEVLYSNYGNTRLAPSWKWFGTDAPDVRVLQIANNRLRHSDIAHDAFDGFFDSSEAAAADASAMVAIYMEGQTELGHINLRWFAPLVNLDWLGTTGSLVDTYFYSEGTPDDVDSRKVDGSSTAATGANDFTADTTAGRDAIGTAIKAEIDRYWNTAKSTTGGVNTAEIATTERTYGMSPGFNLCDSVDRDPVVAAHIISVLKDPDRDTDTAVPSAYTAFGCPSGVSALTKSALASDAAWTHWRTPFQPEGGSLTELNVSDVKGLTMSHVVLNSTGLKSMEAGVFQGISPGVEVLEAKWLRDLRIDLKAWFGTSASDLVSLAMPDTDANTADIAYNEFDTFTNLDYIDLRGTPLGYVNTRWFAQLSSLTGLMLGGTNIAKFFYDADGNDPHDSSTTGVKDFWVEASLQTLQTDINAARMTAGSTTLAITGNAGFYNATAAYSVPNLAVDICDRPKAMWAELMRIFDYIDDPTWDARWVTNAGDVRHARTATLDATDCRPVPGIAIVKDTLATVDPASTTYDADVHDLSIYDGTHTLDLRLHDTIWDSAANGLGPELDPDDFANLYHAVGMRLQRSGITTIPANTFATSRNLETLYLNGNSLDNADFAGTNFLQHFTKLRVLDLSDNLLTDFNSSSLPSTTRGTSANPLRTLRLTNNPLKTFDVTGLDLTTFRINGTQVSSLHSSVFDMDNLVLFYYQTPTLRLDGLHPDGAAEFLKQLPGTIASSEPYAFIGNELMAEDADLDSAALQFQLDHQARLKAINANVTGADSRQTTAVLRDPCRPDVRSIGSPSDWGDSSKTGDLCLTADQKNSFISSLASYNGLNFLRTENADLSDSQVASLLRSIDDQPLRRINLISNPSAFGAGFDNSQLSVFDNVDWSGVWQLQIVHSALNYTQASTILSNLASGAYEPSVRRDAAGNVRWNQHYFEELDLSYNADLFTGATTEQLSTFLNGVTAIRDGWGPFTLRLAGTNLDFDKFDAILDSIQQSPNTLYDDDPPWNTYGIRRLDVSENPNLWNRWNASSSSWENVDEDEIQALAMRLEGLDLLDIGDTGLSGGELDTLTDYLGRFRADNPPHHSKTGPIDRIASFSVAGTDLGAVTPSDLEDTFARFNGTSTAPETAAPALRSLNLARTNINCEDLDAITDGLDTAGVLVSITRLTLDGNPAIFTGCAGESPTYTCDSSSNTDPVVTLLARFTNLREFSIDDAGLDFGELQCAVEGLDMADGTPNDGAKLVKTISIENNQQAFATASNAQVVAVFSALPNAYKVLRNTGLTVAQAQAVLMDEQTGQTGDELDETARRFAARNPAFAFRTPLPDDLKVESGRGSVRVTFTHDPMYDGREFTVLRYEYRYRERPSDTSESWGTTGTERWRTASIDLNTRGAKSFVIYGLEAESIYQVQLRASSLAQPAIDTASGGTNINLPQVKRIEPTVTEVSIRAGDAIRLEVDVYGAANVLDNTIPEVKGTKLVFDWSDSPASGAFAEPNDERRVVYTAPSLPGTYTVQVQAQPDGICVDHHKTDFDITDAHRAPCIATFTVRVSRAATPPEPVAEPINPAGAIPTSLTDASGVAYTVFTPVEGGTFTGTGITVSAAKGAVPDRQLLGVAATVSAVSAPEPTPGARMTVAGELYDINGIQQAGSSPLVDFTLDDPLMVCLPMPAEFRANISDVVAVERSFDGSYGILTTKLRQSAGELSVCGNVSTLPATVGVAKLGVVEAPPPTPTPDVITPETGATDPGVNVVAILLVMGILLMFSGPVLRELALRAGDSQG